MSKIYLQLSGGLGNQLFQFAFAKTLSLITKKKLIIEIKSKLNDRYKRKVALNSSLIKKHKFRSSFYSFVIFFIFKLEIILKKLFKKNTIINRQWGIFFDDRYFPHSYINFFDRIYKKNIFILGYFQSVKYFDKYKKIIIKCINIKPKKSLEYQFYEKLILKKNSVAICVRLYEEIKKKYKYRIGRVDNENFYNRSIQQIYKKIKNPYFFIFCSHNSIFLKKLKFKNNKNTLSLAGDKKIQDAQTTVKLISLCKHHIVSNSSFYFWGSYLSKNKGIKLYSKNFVNKDILKNN